MQTINLLWLALLLALTGGCGRTNNTDPALPNILPTPLPHPTVASPVQFTDITRAAGLTFHHNNGAFGLKLYPETMGSGVTFIDYDGDGYQDIFLVNGRDWTAAELKGYYQGPNRYFRKQFGFVAPTPRPPRHSTGALYHNNRNGTFTDVTAGSGLDIVMMGMGVAVGDYDNDGKPDLYVTGYGRNYLFHNQSTPGQPHFQEVARAAGVQDGGFSSSAAWVDYDRDGKLDLFVGHYVHWTPALDVWDFGSKVRYPGRGYLKTYTAPAAFDGEPSRLYRNLGQGHFKDVSTSAGINVHFATPDTPPNAATAAPQSPDRKQPTTPTTPTLPTPLPTASEMSVQTVGEEKALLARPEKRRGKAMGVAICDFNHDGWPDLMVANDGVPNYLYENKGNGTFAEVGVQRGVAYGQGTFRRAGMGVDVGDIDQSGQDSIVVGNFSYDNLALFHDDGSHVFTDIASVAEVARPSRFFVTFGCLFLDADNDGWLDILAANGHVQDTIHNLHHELQYAERPLFYINRGQQQPIKFDEVGLQSGAALARPVVGRGLACADIDLDGDLDVLLTTNGSAPMLLRNDLGAKAQLNNVLRLTLEGTRSNRSAIGAQVTVTIQLPGQPKDVSLRRMVKSGSSYLSQSELPLTFGLGRASQIKSLSILWPSGQRTQLHNLQVNQMLTVREDVGIVQQQPLRRSSEAFGSKGVMGASSR
ncbi:MAG: CRTAC1 family protein [Abitibacteriaceae bacterium]|nr:CRTAC1 family protein [Abditibacteriaceae bacterium]